MRFFLTIIFATIMLLCFSPAKAAYTPGAVTKADVAGVMSTNLNLSLMPQSVGYYGIATNGSIFCAVGQGATAAGLVASSTDGVTWTSRTAASGRNWTSMAYGAGKFVALSYDAIIGNQYMTSTDCITWSSTTNANLALMNDIIFVSSSTLFVAAGQGTSNYGLATSPDAVTWTQRIPSGHLSSAALRRPVFGNGVYIAVAADGDYSLGNVVRSTNGTTWESVDEGDIPAASGGYYATGWNGKVFIIITADGYTKTSPNGLTWTTQGRINIPSSTFETVNDVKWNGYTWVVAGKYFMYSSPDGKQWASHPLNFNITVNRLLLNGTRFIGVLRTPVPSTNYGAFSTLGVSF